MRKYDFYKNRFYALGLSLTFLLIGVVMMLVNGLNLDIEFKGGSLLNYTYTGDLNLDEVRELASKTMKAPVTVQATEALSGKAEGGTRQNIVINVAGDAAISTEAQSALKEALRTAYPEHKIEVGEVLVVDAFIGREALNNGLLASLIAAVLIVAYVWFRFRSISGPSAGVFSLIVLLHDVLISFFAFVVFGFALNDAVIAVVLSILGWSVNDTIVIYDRIRENANLYRNGETLPELVNRSIHQSLSRSIATSACAFVAVMVAYGFATLYNIQSIKEFALPMAIGLLAGTYSSIFLATPFWASWKVRKGRHGYED